MPQGGRVGRSIAKSQGAFVTPIVTNNPVFQVKLVDVDDKLEQPAAQQEPMKDEIRRGEAVVGTAIGTDGKKKHKGIIQNITKDAKNNNTSFTIIDEDGDQIKLDPTSVARLDLHDDGKNTVAGDDFKVMEMISFDEWKGKKGTNENADTSKSNLKRFADFINENYQSYQDYIDQGSKWGSPEELEEDAIITLKRLLPSNDKSWIKKITDESTDKGIKLVIKLKGGEEIHMYKTTNWRGQWEFYLNRKKIDTYELQKTLDSIYLSDLDKFLKYAFSYDFNAHYIDDGRQYQRAQKNNELIKSNFEGKIFFFFT